MSHFISVDYAGGQSSHTRNPIAAEVRSYFPDRNPQKGQGIAYIRNEAHSFDVLRVDDWDEVWRMANLGAGALTLFDQCQGHRYMPGDYKYFTRKTEQMHYIGARLYASNWLHWSNKLSYVFQSFDMGSLPTEYRELMRYIFARLIMSMCKHDNARKVRGWYLSVGRGPNPYYDLIWFGERRNTVRRFVIGRHTYEQVQKLKEAGLR